MSIDLDELIKEFEESEKAQMGPIFTPVDVAYSLTKELKRQREIINCLLSYHPVVMRDPRIKDLL